MVIYNDSYNNGNPNVFNGTDGDNWALGAGLDIVTGNSNETLNYYGGLGGSQREPDQLHRHAEYHHSQRQ